MYAQEGVSSFANFITAYEELLIKPILPFPICNVFLVSEANFLDFYIAFTSKQLLQRQFDEILLMKIIVNWTFFCTKKKKKKKKKKIKQKKTPKINNHVCVM